MAAGGALATFKDDVNCCVATLPDEAVTVAEMVAGAAAVFAEELVATTAAVTAFTCAVVLVLCVPSDVV